MVTKNIIGIGNVFNFLKTEDLSSIDKVFAEYKNAENDMTLLIELNDVDIDIYKVCLNLKHSCIDDIEDRMPLLNNIKMHLLNYKNIMKIRAISRIKRGNSDNLETTITNIFAITNLRIEDNNLIFY